VSRPSIWRRIRRDALLLGAGNLATVIGQLAFRSILIAVLVPASYGRLSLVLSVYNTVWIVGASGLPSAVARHIALIAPGDDSAVRRAALRASAVPAALAAVAIATVAGLVLHSLVACALAAAGLLGLVYSLLAMGVLRGRGHMGAAASIMPAAAAGEVAPLALLWLCGAHITTLVAFAVFCLGNASGLATGLLLTIRSRPPGQAEDGHARRPRSSLAARGRQSVEPLAARGRESVEPLAVQGRQSVEPLAARGRGWVEPPPSPGPRELLGFSLWLGAATAGVAVLPMVVRAAAALDSYTVVAMVDVAIVLLAIPQRIGTVILFAVVPHAARAGRGEGATFTVSLRENLLVAAPFAALAAMVAFTPLVGWAFGLLGRPAYADSARYLALALLASPARMLYGMVEGILIGHGEGRFLAANALTIAAGASAAILAGVLLGSTFAAFGAFAVALWAIYLCGLWRVNRLAADRRASVAPAASGMGLPGGRRAILAPSQPPA
jgi:O-antigen/teichoic acid export membrane protein